MKLTAVFQKFPEGYAAFVEELPGANTQGKTLEEARGNLVEAVQLVLEANRQIAGAMVRRIVEQVNVERGIRTPEICTPEELMEV